MTKQQAREIADGLWRDLEDKKISVIGIDVIRARIKETLGCTSNLMEQWVCRLIVKKVG